MLTGRHYKYDVKKEIKIIYMDKEDVAVDGHKSAMLK